MKRCAGVIKREFLRILPVFLFFWISFTIINISESFLLKRAGLTAFTFADVFIAAALIAKIFLVIDHLRIVNLFSKKPLIYTTIWKVFVYWFITLLVRLAIRFTPFLFSHQTLPTDYHLFITDVNWNLFIAIQVWYVMLFVLFVTARELFLVIGPAKMRRIFFGPPK